MKRGGGLFRVSEAKVLKKDITKIMDDFHDTVKEQFSKD